MCKSSIKYWSMCVLTYLIDQLSVVVDFLQLSPGTDLKNDPIAILVPSCAAISKYKALYPPLYFSHNLTTITIPRVLVQLRTFNDLFVNFLNNKLCVFSALFPDRHILYVLWTIQFRYPANLFLSQVLFNLILSNNSSVTHS